MVVRQMWQNLWPGPRVDFDEFADLLSKESWDFIALTISEMVTASDSISRPFRPRHLRGLTVMYHSPAEVRECGYLVRSKEVCIGNRLMVGQRYFEDLYSIH